MFPFLKKQEKKIGLSPGSLVYTGKKRDEKIVLDVLDYTDKKITEKTLNKVEDSFPFRKTPTVTWLNVSGIHNPDIIKRIGENFELHPLVLEDILSSSQRPKIEVFDNYIFLILKMLYYKNNEIKSEQVSIIIGKNYVISFQETVGDVFDPLRQRIRSAKGRIRKRGSDYLAYALFDILVDNYFVVLEKISDEVEGIEEEVLDNPSTETLNKLHNMRRELIFLRRSVWPLREVINSFQREETKLIAKSTITYLRDVYDHTIQVIDTVETLRDMVGGLMDVYLSSVSNKMNEVMKVLTIFAAIFIPLTFIAGIYGMNFEYMPELGYRLAYPILWGVFIFLGVGLFLYFKNKKWI